MKKGNMMKNAVGWRMKGLRQLVVAQLLSGFLLLVLAMPAAAVDANLALNQTIIPSTNVQLGAPGNVVDGNYASNWYSYQGGMSNSIEFVLDLGAVADVR
ncbi:MAG: hypothetical protein EHM79_07405 [Geobacter sp.]|nr:MAG: hypothetical protein EHM79_07405 [Geobacter sp.]